MVSVPVRPAIAISDTMMMVGSDAGAVEAALEPRSAADRRVGEERDFSRCNRAGAARRVGLQLCRYSLLFERADAAARPLLLMGAAFYPALATTVDFSKWPAPEAIAKHLSPIVMSQRYDHDGYVTESVGPVTFREATYWIGGRGRRLVYLSAGRTKEPRSVADRPDKSRNGPCDTVRFPERQPALSNRSLARR